MRLRNDRAQKALPFLLCLVASSVPLGLTGCSEPSTTTGGTTSTTTSTKPALQGGPGSTFKGEETFVSPEEEKRFVDGTPDTSVKFPEEEFVKGKKLRDLLKPAEGEKVLKSKLDEAVKSSAGETRLGQYCVRINNCLHMQGKETEAMKYAIIATHIFYKQPPEKRPLPMLFFNVHLHQGLGYKALRIYPEAEKHLRKAINIAAGAPAGQVDWNYHRLCYYQLIDMLTAEKKFGEIKVVKADVKALEDSHKVK